MVVIGAYLAACFPIGIRLDICIDSSKLQPDEPIMPG